MRADEVDPAHPNFGKLVPCGCNAEYHSRRQAKLSRISGLLPSELEVTLQDVIGRGSDTHRMIEAARRFIKQPPGLLTIWGGVGNGKTLVLQGIVNELREKSNFEGVYVRFVDLLDYVRAGYDDRDNEGSDRQRYLFLKSVKVLAIDEADKARMTEWAFEFRTKFFDDRYRQALDGSAFTVLAMNSDPAELANAGAVDIYDRLRQFEIVRNSDSSMRPALRRVSGG